jgi:hypothetical protein
MRALVPNFGWAPSGSIEPVEEQISDASRPMVLDVSMLRLGQQSGVFGSQRRRERVSRCNVKASISKRVIVWHIAEVQRPHQWNTAIAGRSHKASRRV